jgi:hypothetical protein
LALIHIDILDVVQFLTNRMPGHQLDLQALPNRYDGGQNLADAV